MRTISNDTFTVVYPNTLFETLGRFAYIKVQLASPEENVDVKVSVSSVGVNTELVRKTDASGAVIFPVGLFAESVALDNMGVVYLTVEASGKQQYLNILQPIAGYAKAEVDDGFEGKTRYPAAPCVVLYPQFKHPAPFFFPSTNDFHVMSASGVSIGYVEHGPYVDLDVASIPQEDIGKNIGVGQTLGTITVQVKTHYDNCTDGVFLKWTDAAGMPYLYRWTQETETDEVSVNSTYRKLDDTLTPYDVQTKTRAKRYTLHSRIVERDIFEMCRTILGAQEVFMYDLDASDWVRVLIEDAESEDTGAVMQDVKIEVVKYEYL